MNKGLLALNIVLLIGVAILFILFFKSFFFLVKKKLFGNNFVKKKNNGSCCGHCELSQRHIQKKQNNFLMKHFE